MPALERRVSRRGPRFWIDDEQVMFCNQIDGSTRDGPREATDADREAYPEAWDAMGKDDDGLGAPMLSAHDPKVKPAPPPKPFAERRARAAAATEV